MWVMYLAFVGLIVIALMVSNIYSIGRSIDCVKVAIEHNIPTTEISRVCKIRGLDGNN